MILGAFIDAAPFAQPHLVRKIQIYVVLNIQFFKRSKLLLILVCYLMTLDYLFLRNSSTLFSMSTGGSFVPFPAATGVVRTRLRLVTHYLTLI